MKKINRNNYGHIKLHNKDVEVIIFEHSSIDKQGLYIKKVGDEFYTPLLGGMRSSSSANLQSRYSATDYFNDVEYEIYIEDNHAFMSGGNCRDFNFFGVSMERNIRDIMVIDLPIIETITSIFTNESTNYILTNDALNHTYEGYGFYEINGPLFKKLDIKLTERYRDGGTTYYDTELGVLYTPVGSKNKASLDAKELETVKISDNYFSSSELKVIKDILKIKFPDVKN